MRNPLIPIILVVLSIATYFAFAAPWWAEINSTKADIEVAKVAVTQGNELKELVQNLTEKVNSVPPEDRSRLQAVLPFQIDEILFLNDINVLAGNRGLQARNLVLAEDTSTAGNTAAVSESDGEVKGSSSQKTKTASFAVTAKYPTFISFLRDIEQSLVLYEIKSVSFSETGTSDTSGTSGKSGQSTAPQGDDYSVKFTTYSVE